MKLAKTLLLVTLVSLGEAATDSAKAYIFPKPKPLLSAKAPTLTPTQARLVIAQRLDISQYHQISSSKDASLTYINSFGGRSKELFPVPYSSEPPYQLVVMLGVESPGRVETYLSGEALIEPSFEISGPPSQSANERLVDDLSAQISWPFSKLSCGGKLNLDWYDDCLGVFENRIVYIDLESEQAFQDFRYEFEALKPSFDDGKSEALVIVMPKSSRATQHAAKPYGLYDMPNDVHNARRSISEEPMTDVPESSPVPALAAVNTLAPVIKSIAKRPMSVCHASYNSCVSATDNCSGNGNCYLKYNGSSGSLSCYACGCVASYNANSSLTTYWGGAACSKKDISAQFWLLAGFSILLMGLASWAVGMLFSVGEEKLPGVIGAGVSGPKAGR